MSGRGLGITGGTIDKLESIPGFSTNLTKEQFLDQARQIGCVIASQTADLVPADKKMYELRDVTGTVECIPLIASSVMSKKIACGASTILLDVKFGSGAFMKDIDSARELARTMIDIGNGIGRRTIAAITGMDQPLGYAIGNAIEVAEAINTLQGAGPSDLRDICIELGALLLTITRVDESIQATKLKLTHILDSGEALGRFRMMVKAQGGDPLVTENTAHLPQAKLTRSIYAASSGYVQAVDAGIIGRVAGMLGAGRRRKEDSIDPTAGVLLRKKIGDIVRAGEEIASLLYSGSIEIESVVQFAQSAFTIGSDFPSIQPIVYETLGF
jgi:pyrimidine-nucleoside phosphorylase/thymidine phosphorylase